MSLSALVPYIASGTSIGLTLSPLASVLEMIKARNSKGMAFFPLLSMLVNNMVAVAFGIELRDPFVVSVAVVNGLLSLFYVAAYFAMAPPVERTPLRRQLAAAYFMYAVLIGYITVLATDNAELCLGLAADVAAVVMFGAPLVQLKQVVKKKSVEGLVLSVSLMSAVCSFTWMVYGTQLDNPFLYVPNGLGFGLALIQLSLFVLYPSPGSLALGGSHRHHIKADTPTSSPQRSLANPAAEIA